MLWSKEGINPFGLSSIIFQAQAHSYCFLNVFSLNSQRPCGSLSTAAGNSNSPRHGFISVHMLLKPNLLIFRLIRRSVSANGRHCSQEHLCLSNRTASRGAHTWFMQHISQISSNMCCGRLSFLFKYWWMFIQSTRGFFSHTFTSLLFFLWQCWCLNFPPSETCWGGLFQIQPPEIRGWFWHVWAGDTEVA